MLRAASAAPAMTRTASFVVSARPAFSSSSSHSGAVFAPLAPASSSSASSRVTIRQRRLFHSVSAASPAPYKGLAGVHSWWSVNHNQQQKTLFSSTSSTPSKMAAAEQNNAAEFKNDILEAVRPALEDSLAELYGQNPAKALNLLGKRLQSKSLQNSPQPDLRVYGAFNYCPFVWRVHAFLAHYQLPHAKLHLDLLAGEHRKPEYLAINPQGLVPAVVDASNGGFVALESGGILQYLDAVWNNGQGTPSSPGELAKFYELWYRVVGGLKMFEPRVCIYGGEYDHAAAKALLAEYRYLENGMKDDQLFLATKQRPSLVDFLVIPNVQISLMCGADFTELGLPRLEAWRRRMMELPGVAEGDVLEGWKRAMKVRQGREWEQRRLVWQEDYKKAAEAEAQAAQAAQA